MASLSLSTEAELFSALAGVFVLGISQSASQDPPLFPHRFLQSIGSECH